LAHCAIWVGRSRCRYEANWEIQRILPKLTFSVNPSTLVKEANEAAEHDDKTVVYRDQEESTVLNDKVSTTAEEWKISFFTAQITMEVKVAFDHMVWRKCRATHKYRHSLTKFGEMKWSEAWTGRIPCVALLSEGTGFFLAVMTVGKRFFSCVKVIAHLSYIHQPW